MLSENISSFDSVALNSSRDFRLIMDAMARPGKVITLNGDYQSTGLMNAGSVMVVETLCDHETPVWLDQTLSTNDIIEMLRFSCSVPIIEHVKETMFVFFASMPSADELANLPVGTPAYPDSSATLVIQVDGLSNGQGLTLTGPGIQSSHRLQIDGVDGKFWSWWRENTMRFPLGLDVIFTTDRSIAALPRTTKVLEVA